MYCASDDFPNSLARSRKSFSFSSYSSGLSDCFRLSSMSTLTLGLDLSFPFVHLLMERCVKFFLGQTWPNAIDEFIDVTLKWSVLRSLRDVVGNCFTLCAINFVDEGLQVVGHVDQSWLSYCF